MTKFAVTCFLLGLFWNYSHGLPNHMAKVHGQEPRQDWEDFERTKSKKGSFDLEKIVKDINNLMKMIKEKSGDNPQIITEDSVDDFTNIVEQDPDNSDEVKHVNWEWK